MGYEITLIPGDGIGPEITAASLQVLDATGLKFSWDRQLGGMAAIAAADPPLEPPGVREMSHGLCAAP